MNKNVIDSLHFCIIIEYCEIEQILTFNQHYCNLYKYVFD